MASAKPPPGGIEAIEVSSPTAAASLKKNYHGRQASLPSNPSSVNHVHFQWQPPAAISQRPPSNSHRLSSDLSSEADLTSISSSGQRLPPPLIHTRPHHHPSELKRPDSVITTSSIVSSDTASQVKFFDVKTVLQSFWSHLFSLRNNSEAKMSNFFLFRQKWAFLGYNSRIYLDFINQMVKGLLSCASSLARPTFVFCFIIKKIRGCWQGGKRLTGKGANFSEKRLDFFN